MSNEHTSHVPHPQLGHCVSAPMNDRPSNGSRMCNYPPPLHPGDVLYSEQLHMASSAALPNPHPHSLPASQRLSFHEQTNCLFTGGLGMGDHVLNPLQPHGHELSPQQLPVAPHPSASTTTATPFPAPHVGVPYAPWVDVNSQARLDSSIEYGLDSLNRAISEHSHNLQLCSNSRTRLKKCMTQMEPLLKYLQLNHPVSKTLVAMDNLADELMDAFD